MARADLTGLFWDDFVPPKVKKEKAKCTPPEKVWLRPDYLPYLEEALAFDVDLYSNYELLQAAKNKEALVFDIECYGNYFLVAFMGVVTKKVFYVEMEVDTKLNIEALQWVIDNFLIIGFNSWNYDIPILTVAMGRKSCAVLKQATNDIIGFGMRAHEVLKNYRVRKIKPNHIDLIEVAPLSANLKLYGGRLHCKKMQDLPFDPETLLTPEQIAITRFYCVNDLRNTLLLYESLKAEIDLRIVLGQTYKLDLRSKSDAQIAEAVIKSELKKKGLEKIIVPEVVPGSYFYYEPPAYLEFKTTNILERVKQNPFFINNSGNIVPCYYADFTDWSSVGTSLRLNTSGEWVPKPKDWQYKPLVLNGVQFTMGMGGLHTVEKTIAYKSNDEYTIRDVDVESYYPRIIINLQLFPKQLGRGFLTVFNSITVKRLQAKEAKNMPVSNSLKIVINGSFGKFGSVYSALCSPNLIIQTTLTGQLSLLMLIEWLGFAGIKVISANTDGVVSYVHKSQEQAFVQIIAHWENVTKFKMEETVYSAIYSRDVNNYIAVKTNGKTKCKGAYSNHWNDPTTFRLHKNPTNLICIDAVEAFLTKEVPIEKTILECTDITKFITVRDVKGGGVKVWEDGKIDYLGKAIRWYYARDIKGPIIYALSGNMVARTEGAKPCMELPDEFPNDIDTDWYIEESYKILEQIAAIPCRDQIQLLNTNQLRE